jgi:hypothetical protein
MPPRTPGLLGWQRSTVRARAATERVALTRVWAEGRRREPTARRTLAEQRSQGAVSLFTQIAARRPKTTSLPHTRMVGRSREAISPLTQTAVRRQETVSLPHGRPVVRSRETPSRLMRLVGDTPEAVSPLIPRTLETTSRLTLAAVHRPEAVAPLGWEAACRHGTTSPRAWVAVRQQETTPPPHGWVAAAHAWAAAGLAWAAVAGEGRPKRGAGSRWGRLRAFPGCRTPPGLVGM